MKFLKRINSGTAAVIVLAAVLQLATPRAVHSVVSALVTVANTSANPVPTIGMPQAPSQIVELAAIVSPGLTQPVFALDPSHGIDSPYVQYVVPDGQVLVITGVEFDPSGGSHDIQLVLGGGFFLRERWSVVATGATTQLTFPTGIVLPSGAAPEFQSSGLIGSGNTFTVLHGYLASAP